MLRRLSLAPCLLLVAQCGNLGTETDNPAAPEGTELVRSPLEYVTDPEVSSSDFEALQQGHRVFALELFQQLRSAAGAEENLMVSPLSVSTLMAMTYAGARANTATQMASALHFDRAPEALHPALNELASRLGQQSDSGSMTLEMSNALWASRELVGKDAIASQFLDTLALHYDTGLFLADFAGAPEQTRQSINDWVFENTHELVEDLLPAGSVGPNTSLALSNAIYFGASWQLRFDPEVTEDSPFTLPNGDQVTVPMMQRVEDFPFVFDTDWRAAELPYADSSVSMILVLPNQGEFESFEAEFDADRVQEVVTALAQSADLGFDGMLSLQLPRFSFETSVDLVAPLQQLGMTDAFSSGAADFSGIADSGLAIDAAFHKTSIAVDENGTVAAAASGEVLVPLSINPTLAFDRPFLFLIYDRATETVLFVGRFLRPEGEATAPASPAQTPSDAETICSILTECSERTTTEATCVASFATDEPASVDQCADCLLALYDGCARMADCYEAERSACAADACASECPDHQF